MTKRPPKLIFAAVLLYIYLVIFALAMIIGASYLALSAFTIVAGQGPSVALPYFVIGVSLLAGAYLANVFATYFLTKKWSWRLMTSFTLQPVEKQSKKK